MFDMFRLQQVEGVFLAYFSYFFLFILMLNITRLGVNKVQNKNNITPNLLLISSRFYLVEMNYFLHLFSPRWLNWEHQWLWCCVHEGPDPAGVYGMVGGLIPCTVCLKLMGQTSPLRELGHGWAATWLWLQKMAKFSAELPIPVCTPAEQSSLSTLGGAVQVGGTGDTFWVKCASSTWNSGLLCSCDSLWCVNSVTLCTGRK